MSGAHARARTTPAHQWVPLLDGASAARARGVVERITRRLVAQERTARGGLGAGAAGIALFLDEAALALDRPDAAEAAAIWLERAFDHLGREPLSVIEGLAGVVWTASRLSSASLTRGDQEVLDEILLRRMEASPPPFELLFGVAGVAIATASRHESRTTRAIRAAATRALHDSACVQPGGRTWRTDASWYWSPRGDGGSFELGSAHGAPGAIAALAQLDPDAPGLDDAVRWLLAHVDEHGWIADYLDGEGRAHGRTDAWCKGAPGVASALLVAAEATGRADWREAALALARAVHRRLEPRAATDPCFCHGTAGFAHQLARWSCASGDAAFAEGARRWYERTTALAEAWIDRAAPGLLVGAAGVGLVLVAGLSARDPTWDALFAISRARPQSS